MTKCIIENCESKAVCRTLCITHYNREKRSGRPLPPKRQAPIDWLKQAIASRTKSDCIIWPFSIRGHGYGQVTFNGRQTYAHRVALILATGKDPKHLQAAHGRCHNRLCVNPHPNHLRWATNSENQKDRVKDGTDAQGEKCHLTKLTEAQAKKAKLDPRPLVAIAAELGVHSSTICLIKKGRNWGHID